MPLNLPYYCKAVDIVPAVVYRYGTIFFAVFKLIFFIFHKKHPYRILYDKGIFILIDVQNKKKSIVNYFITKLNKKII